MDTYQKIRRFWLLLAVFSIPNLSNAQLMERPYTGEIPQQSVYLELGGNGLIYSFNYDVLFPGNWGFRLGGGYMWDATGKRIGFGDYRFRNSTAFVGVIMGHHMVGEGSSKLGSGSGLLLGASYDRSDWDFIEPPGATFTLGYRYYPKEDSRVTFKAAFTPIITRTGFHPRFGISFGITLTPEGDTSIR
jgi:hypothetical protein